MGALHGVAPPADDPVIRGFFESDSGQRYPMVRVGLFLPALTGQFAVVDFLVDTGATLTCLHPKDAIFLLGLDPAALADPTRWSDRVPTAGIGGSVEYYRVSARYLFIHEEIAPQQIDAPIHIAQLRAENQQLPSLLGRDLLAHFNMAFTIAGDSITLQ